MCGRFTIRIPQNLLMQHFGIGHSELQLAMRYNVAPTQQIPVVRMADGKRQLSTMRWGLVPSWADDVKIGYKMINARSEDAAKKPSFRSAMKRRRCLIPADGFFEWEKIGKQKQPHRFHRADGQPFAFAGLWETWSKTEPALETCTILTTRPNELVGKYHDRMPGEPRLTIRIIPPQRLTYYQSRMLPTRRRLSMYFLLRLVRRTSAGPSHASH
jgi:putative SOS response-associated peptidase YedK